MCQILDAPSQDEMDVTGIWDEYVIPIVIPAFAFTDIAFRTTFRRRSHV